MCVCVCVFVCRVFMKSCSIFKSLAAKLVMLKCNNQKEKKLQVELCFF